MNNNKQWYVALLVISAVVFLCLFFNKDWIESAQNLYKGDDWQNNRNFYELNNISLGDNRPNQKVGNMDAYCVRVYFTASDSDVTVQHKLGRKPNGCLMNMPDTNVMVWKSRYESWTSRTAIFQSSLVTATGSDSYAVNVILY